MKIAPLLLGLLLVAWTAPATCAAGDVVESSDVLVPDGPFGTMRRVDSETLILPNAGAVMRAQQQRTAREESRERAAVRREVVAVPSAAIPVPATEPDLGLSPASPMAPSSDAIMAADRFAAENDFGFGEPSVPAGGFEDVVSDAPDEASSDVDPSPAEEPVAEEAGE